MGYFLGAALIKLINNIPEIWVSSVTQSCPTLCDPINCSMPGLLPIHHQLPEFTQTHVHWLGDAIQPFHPLSSPSPPAPNPSQHQSLFQSHYFKANRRGKGGGVTHFLLLASKITVDCDRVHEIRRQLLLGRKAVTKLDSVLKSRGIIVPINVPMSTLSTQNKEQFYLYKLRNSFIYTK